MKIPVKITMPVILCIFPRRARIECANESGSVPALRGQILAGPWYG